MTCENNSSLVREKVVPFTLQHTMDTVTSSSVLLKSMELTPHQRERFEKHLISKHSLLCFFMHMQRHSHHTMYHTTCNGVVFLGQNGLQPIHNAAQEGQESVVRLLVDDFHQKPDATSNVSLYRCLTDHFRMHTINLMVGRIPAYPRGMQ